ncbi:hypothetical protein HHTV1_42 [Haloarcula hispanica tailed virus 1]|uniref:Uncharacterized protein n=1 Tax=Haloarcula hispanica tailed virus 1 TaxID=1273750 RepID=R4T6K3_9CAUD|nr:hypothetical protein M198_gp41 [Haloarcula hispanica tailed virus 1]AGM11329.1 hypothetical protein HHTV1_42 [Haloarcula hispanica tailed virus 1]
MLGKQLSGRGASLQIGTNLIQISPHWEPGATILVSPVRAGVLPRCTDQHRITWRAYRRQHTDTLAWRARNPDSTTDRTQPNGATG